MKSTTTLILVLALIGLAASPISAQGIEAFTGENLKDACESLVLAVRGISPISQDDPGAMLCLGYIAGWTQAMERLPDKPYCLPPVEDSLPGDLADLIVTFVDGHPDRSQNPAHEIVLAAFQDAFPCPDEGNPESEEGDQE